MAQSNTILPKANHEFSTPMHQRLKREFSTQPKEKSVEIEPITPKTPLVEVEKQIIEHAVSMKEIPEVPIQKEQTYIGSPKLLHEKRQVTEAMALKFAEEEDLMFLGETSCLENINNCQQIFMSLLSEVHKTQTDLVKQGLKLLEDLKFGEEERNMRYDRCCY